MGIKEIIAITAKTKIIHKANARENVSSKIFLKRNDNYSVFLSV